MGFNKRKFHFVPRRSPRLHERHVQSDLISEEPEISSSIVDLSLPVKNGLQHQPAIRSFGKGASLKSNLRSKSLKRLRESNVSLQSIENLMPSSLKRIRSCNDAVALEANEVKTMTSCQVLGVAAQVLRSEEAVFVKPESPLVKKTSGNALSRVASFARAMSPRGSFRRKGEPVESGLQRSASLRSSNGVRISPSFQREGSKKYKQLPTPARRRCSQLWSESVADFQSEISDHLTPQQIKRQEAIYELYCGERDLVEDMKLLKEVYFNPISKLKLLSDDDLNSIFGSVQALLPLHEDLVAQLESIRSADGSIDQIAEVLLNWIPTLRPYIPYCAQSLAVKELLEEKVKENSHLSDFLQRCLESPFSRKLALWTFLDSPRSRLVKYPLLISSIRHQTPKEHPDRKELYRAIKLLEDIIKEADEESGVAKCALYRDKLHYCEESYDRSRVSEATVLICNGSLKNKNGTKLEAFLFDTAFVMARAANSKSGGKIYQVFAQPLDVAEIEVTDLVDGEVKIGGSFRTTLTRGPPAKHAFRVCARDPLRGKSYVLQAHDPHDKKQWLNSFRLLASTHPSILASSNSMVDIKGAITKSPSSSQVSITYL